MTVGANSNWIILVIAALAGLAPARFGINSQVPAPAADPRQSCAVTRPTWIYGFLGDEPVFSGDRAIVRSNNVEPDGRFRVKYLWLVATREPLVVEVRPVGSVETVFTLDYGGQYATASFRPSSLLFPGAGCWTVRARTTSSELSFVTYVERDK